MPTSNVNIIQTLLEKFTGKPNLKPVILINYLYFVAWMMPHPHGGKTSPNTANKGTNTQTNTIVYNMYTIHNNTQHTSVKY